MMCNVFNAMGNGDRSAQSQRVETYSYHTTVPVRLQNEEVFREFREVGMGRAFSNDQGTWLYPPSSGTEIYTPPTQTPPKRRIPGKNYR